MTGIEIIIFAGKRERGFLLPFIIDMKTRKSKYKKRITEGIRAGKKRKDDKKLNLTRESSDREPPQPGQ